VFGALDFKGQVTGRLDGPRGVTETLAGNIGFRSAKGKAVPLAANQLVSRIADFVTPESGNVMSENSVPLAGTLREIPILDLLQGLRVDRQLASRVFERVAEAHGSIPASEGRTLYARQLARGEKLDAVEDEGPSGGDRIPKRRV
jgi:hypothetical protein